MLPIGQANLAIYLYCTYVSFFSAELNEAKTQLDGTLAQWTVYDDSVEQLQRWLKDLESQVDADSAKQNTLQEKKLQLERVKVRDMFMFVYKESII